MVEDHETQLLQDKSPIGILLAQIAFGMLFLGLGALIAQQIMASANIPDLTNADVLAQKIELNYFQRMSLRLANFVGPFFFFTVTSLVVAYLVARKNMFAFLGFQNKSWWRSAFLLPGIVLGAFPVVLLINWLNHQLPLPDWMWNLENNQSEMIRAMLNMEHASEFWMMLFVAALAPAVGEELFFRGLMQPAIQKWRQNKHLAVWITAILFSAIHLQFAGFLPRMFLGALLGYLMLWQKSLMVPIVVHFLFNAGQVVGVYYFSEAFDSTQEVVAPPIYFWLNGLILMITCLYYLKKRSFK